MRANMPRSLLACLNEIYDNLLQISGQSGDKARRCTGKLHANLHFTRIAEIFEAGLHEYLTNFLLRVSELGEEIRRAFLLRSQMQEILPGVDMA